MTTMRNEFASERSAPGASCGRCEVCLSLVDSVSSKQSPGTPIAPAGTVAAEHYQPLIDAAHLCESEANRMAHDPTTAEHWRQVARALTELRVHRVMDDALAEQGLTAVPVVPSTTTADTVGRMADEVVQALAGRGATGALAIPAMTDEDRAEAAATPEGTYSVCRTASAAGRAGREAAYEIVQALAGAGGEEADPPRQRQKQRQYRNRKMMPTVPLDKKCRECGHDYGHHSVRDDHCCAPGCLCEAFRAQAKGEDQKP